MGEWIIEGAIVLEMICPNIMIHITLGNYAITQSFSGVETGLVRNVTEGITGGQLTDYISTYFYINCST